MTRFKDDILEVTDDEPIIAIVIGEMGWSNYQEEGKPEWKHIVGKLISWKEAEPFLDYEYDTGYGAPDCQAIYAWTQNWIIFVTQYDGATWVSRIPRNPINCIPGMPGG
jgi:hypothetical protein